MKLSLLTKISNFMMVRFILKNGSGIGLIPASGSLRQGKNKISRSICPMSFLCKKLTLRDQTISFKLNFPFYDGSIYS